MLLIKSLDQWFTYEQRELWKETHERAAITTEIFIKNNKKNPLNSLTRITCVETLSLPSLGQPPFSMRVRSLLDHHIRQRIEQIQGMACTSRMCARAHSATMSPLGTLHLKYMSLMKYDCRVVKGSLQVANVSRKRNAYRSSSQMTIMNLKVLVT